MPSLHYWIIVHRPTGHVLPGRRRDQGYTHDKPTEAKPYELPIGPRLFQSSKSALYCLQRYCMGVWTDKALLENRPLTVGGMNTVRSSGVHVPDPSTKRNINEFMVVPLEMKW